ncbi:Cna B-type domain-containing protein [Lactococcus fujiensis]|uniref:Cna B-type domain-containing protein n=1 Tax=Lactococcus fujiensis TaxID=610251 RepID=UPI0025AF61C5|nr:Cna B-type domain-containing protein [Lactococcus fujiensis]
MQILKDNQPDGPVQTLNAANNWTYTQINLDPASKYQAVEVNVPSGYSPSYSMSVDVNGAGVQTITNTHIPATTDLTGTKTWNDSNNQDGIRPASINVHLIANGNTANPVQSITTSADTGWNYTFSNVPVNANGTPITYTVTEDPVSGYTSTSTGLNLTNSYTPKTINVSGTKTWDDNNNQDGLRPSAITVNLIANGDTANPVASTTATAANNWAYTFSNVPENAAGTPITYTVTENNVPGYTATYNGTNITNTHIPATTSVSGTKTWDDNNNQDGMRPASITITLSANGKVVDSQEVTAANNWQYSFTNLAMNSGGNPIDYSVSESDVPNYTSAKDGYNFTNTHTPLTTSISGEKTWVDNDNQDGLRPSTITVNLIANGDTANPVATTQATAANNWAYNFTDLPQYANGKMITYSVEETPVTGYTATYNGMNITNTHTTDTTSVTGSKTWNDANNQDGMRPSSITVNLLANGKIVDSQPVTAANNWEYAFNNLPVNASGSPITYTVSEDEVANYTSTIKGTDITNTHNPLLTSISGTKLWADNNNQDVLRPSSISVNLIANGDTANPVATKIVTAADNWAYSFTDFPQFADGKLITYTVDETPVVGYTTTYNGTNITNTHVPATTSVVGTKTWNDANNQDGMRQNQLL